MTDKAKIVEAEIMSEEFSERLVLSTFSEFDAQLAKIKEESDNLVFDYSKPEDVKLAKAHVAKLRKMNPLIKAARKKAKDPFDAIGKALIVKEKELLTFASDRIIVHDKPIQDLKEKEEKRKADLIDRVQQIVTSGQKEYLNSTEASEMLKALDKLSLEEDLEEYQEAANIELEKAISLVESKRDILAKNEENQRENERLRAENAEKDQKIREDEIARQSAAKAEFEKKQALENADREKREALNKVERDKKEAAELADRQQKAAVQAEKDRQEREKAEQNRKKQEEERLEREASEDLNHRKSINRKALASFIAAGFSEEKGKEIVTLIAKGKIDSVLIRY